MARVNINILGIRELKWTGMGEYNSNDNYAYYCWQESLRRNGVALIVKKRVWNAVLGCNLKNDRMISVHFQGKPFSITVIQVNTLTSRSWRIWSWMVLWRPMLSHFSRVQLCATPPGSPTPGILQARTLEWVAISFSNAWKWKVKVKSLSSVWHSVTPWTAAFQAPLSMGFSRQEYLWDLLKLTPKKMSFSL